MKTDPIRQKPSISKAGSKNTNAKANSERLNTSELANVNSYKHFLAVPHTGHNYIQWAFGLRSGNNKKNIQSSNGIAPPQTYYKTTQCQKVKHTTADINTKVNISEFEHLAMHRIVSNPSSSQLLAFETTLRWNDEKSKEYEKFRQRQRKWCTIPKKERHQDPVFIRSKSLKKKILSPQQYESAVDGSQKYPKFTEKIVKNKNVNQYRHMIKGKVGKGPLNLPSISWQTNLRSY